MGLSGESWGESDICSQSVIVHKVTMAPFPTLPASKFGRQRSGWSHQLRQDNKSEQEKGLVWKESMIFFWAKHALLLLLLLSHFSYVRLCDSIDGSPSGSAVPGILQARTLEWVAISSSNAWKWKVKVKSLSRVRLFETPWTAAFQAPPSMGFSRQEYWSGAPLPFPKHALGKIIKLEINWNSVREDDLAVKRWLKAAKWVVGGSC